MTAIFATISCIGFVVTILHIKLIGLPVENPEIKGRYENTQ